MWPAFSLGHVRAAQELELDLAGLGVEAVGLERRLVLRDAVVGEDERRAVEMVGGDHVPAAWQGRVAVPFEQHGAGRGQLEGCRGFLAVHGRRLPRFPQAPSAARRRPPRRRRLAVRDPWARSGPMASAATASLSRQSDMSSSDASFACSRRVDAPAYLIYRRTGLDEIDERLWRLAARVGRGRATQDRGLASDQPREREFCASDPQTDENR